MSVEDFMDLTPIEFYNALQDNDEYEISKIKPVCEAIRMEAWWVVNVNLDKKHRVRKKERIMTFPWDKDLIRKPQTKAQMISTMRFIGKSNTNSKVVGTRRKRQEKERIRREKFKQKT